LSKNFSLPTSYPLRRGGEGRDRDTATNVLAGPGALAGSTAHGLVGGDARVVDAGGAAGDIATVRPGPSGAADSVIAGEGAVADGRGRAEHDLDAPPTLAPSGAPLPPAPPMAELPVMVLFVMVAVTPELMSRPPLRASLPAPPVLPALPMTWLPARQRFHDESAPS
jgi:hypothetical protein